MAAGAAAAKDPLTLLNRFRVAQIGIGQCLIAGIGSILMGLLANLPIALAPAMGLNAFFAFVVVAGMGYSWQVGMGTIFWGALGLLILTLLRVRYWLIANIPLTLRVGITAGIGARWELSPHASVGIGYHHALTNVNADIFEDRFMIDFILKW